jgi:hypothetical protein
MMNLRPPFGGILQALKQRHTRIAFVALVMGMIQSLPAAASDAAPHWLEDSLHGSAKMNTVVAVTTIILLGIFLWLYLQDRRLSRMEEKIDQGAR